MATSDQARPPPDHRKNLLKLFNSLAYKHSAWQVFADFNEAAAISLSNAVDLAQAETREARYMQLIQRYSRDELQAFPQMLGELTLALEDRPSDVLGHAFHELELHNKWAGQFFTPYDVCRMMAKMILGGTDPAAIVAERGFVTAAEPAVGSGAMVIALAEEMREAGLNYQRQLHVTATDVDIKCVHMAYTQFSLLHIPAIVVHGNSLSGEVFGQWFTPAHIMGGWSYRLRAAAPIQPEAPAATPAQASAVPEPEHPTPPRGKVSQLKLF